MNVEAALTAASEKLSEAGIPDPRREASSLLAFILKSDRAFLIAHPEHELTADKSILYKSVVKRRASREPFQHIVGRQEFYGLDFEVTRDVLVPRSETELLVTAAIDFLSSLDRPARLCEVGVGSGCVVVSVLHHLPRVTAVGLDISDKAIETARRNAHTHEVDDRVEFRHSDVFDALSDGEKFDAIVSNPPYISAAAFENLQIEVRDYDPRIALTDDADGLTIIRAIITSAPRHLAAGGLLCIEIGQGQDSDVKQMLGRNWANIRFAADLQGIPRTLVANLKPA